MSQRLPITILTGFLGSGKTTLLNRLIEEQPPGSVAVIENEFASTGIDEMLISNQAGRVVPINSGCICCSQNGALVETIDDILRQPDGYQHLFIEATGIANPAEIVAVLLDEAVQEHCVLNAVVCLIDCQQIEEQLRRAEEPRLQVSYADVLVLNKTDLVDLPRLGYLKEMLQQINPLAAVTTAVNGEVNGTDLLVVNAYEGERMVQATRAVSPAHHHHHHAITSVSIELEQPFDFLPLNFLINQLIGAHQGNLYRIKGVVYTANFGHRMILQSVGTTHVWQQGSEWLPDEKKTSRLVFIGRNIRREDIFTYLRQCLQAVDKAAQA